MFCKILLAISTFAFSANAQDFSGDQNLSGQTLIGENNISGNATLNSMTFDKLNVSGNTTFSNLKVFNDFNASGSVTGKGLYTTNINVSGNLAADTLEAQLVNVSGNLAIANAKISGATVVSGSAAVKNSSLTDLQISGSVEFDSSTIEKNVLFSATDRNSVQKLILKNSSVINGNVTFEAGNGVVYFDPTSKINGQVIGAKINQQTEQTNN